MDSKEYEIITKYIYEALGKETGVKIIGYGNTCKLKGKSGVYHQIDVLTSHTDGIHDYKTAIECKYWEEKINKNVVMKVASIIEDTDIHKGVIVSKRGYTKDGVSFAKQKNIGLVELREIEDDDLNGHENIPSFKVGEIIINMEVEQRRPEILSVEYDFVDPNQKTEKINPNLMGFRFKDGKDVPLEKYLTSFREKLHKEEPDKEVQKYFEFKDAYLVNRATREVTQIRGFTLKGKLTVKNMDSKHHIDIVDKIWLIMKSLFENSSFTISETGMIKKDKT